jgi:protein CpxP
MKSTLTRKTTFASTVLTASILGLLASPALAGPHDCGPRDHERADLRADSRVDSRVDSRSERMQAHQQKLHDLLKLSPEQETAWKKLVAAESGLTRPAPTSDLEWAKLTTPERGEKRLAHMKAEQLLMADHVAAIKDFYAVLTPEQKRQFDDFHSMPRRPMKSKTQPSTPKLEKPAA